MHIECDPDVRVEEGGVCKKSSSCKQSVYKMSARTTFQHLCKHQQLFYSLSELVTDDLILSPATPIGGT